MRTNASSAMPTRTIAIPFEIRRDFSKGLVEQAVDGMKSAILGGHYKVGEQVPSLNNVADGALYAMARTGIRVPDDVMVVAQYCPGFGLGFPSGLARLEWNPDEHVKGIAAFVVDQMVGGKNFPLPGIAPRFKMDKD